MRAAVNFCQVCGHPMTDRLAFGHVRRVCPECGYIHFNDPKVAAVILIEHEHRVLLVHRAMDPERGKWALPAGYIDDGENPSEAAKREVREETGLNIEITRLLDVQGGSGTFGASIVIIYAAVVTGGAAQPQDDVSALLWYGKDDVLPDIAFDSTRTMLEAWKQGQPPFNQSQK